MPSRPSRTFGVEEEFLLVDPQTGKPRPIAAAMLKAAAATVRTPDGENHSGFESELQLQQIETATEPCLTLDEVADQLHRARRDASQAAREHGAELAALATSPLPVDPTLFPTYRYRQIAEQFGVTAQEQLSCGTHIHVNIDSEEEGVAVLDRIRPWLAVLLALSANSPFWQGEQTSYASYRTQVWARWPTAGPTELFGDPDTYHRTIKTLIDTKTILDEGMIYFDARLARNYPTVELRVPDVCMLVEDAALLGVLARALVDTAARAWADEVPAPPVRTEALKLATWRASRSGVDELLLHPDTQQPEPALDVVDALFDYVRPSLEETGECKEVRQLLTDLLDRGTGAHLQRSAYRKEGRLDQVVADAVTRTLGE